MIGGISYFHEFAYDLHRRERADPRLDVRRRDRRPSRRAPRSGSSWCRRRWSTSRRPSSRRPKARELTSPPPISTYGFQKLASEYFAKGAWEQYELPYTIVRPFNCVGIGERRALRDTDIMSGNVKLALSHVVPDLVLKVLKGQDPLHILGDGSQVRHYTYGGDLAHGIRLAMESDAARQRGLQPLDGRVDDGARAGVGHLAQDPRPRPRVPLRVRHAVRARRPAARAGRPQGPRAARLRGDDDRSTRCSTRSSRGSATRSRPAGCEPAPAGAVRRPVRRARGQREGRGLARDRRASSSATSTPTRRSSTSPATAAISSAGSHAAPSAGRRTSATCAAALPEDIRFVQASGLDLATAVPNGYFGTVFMSNYLEHLRFERGGHRAAPRRAPAAPAGRSRDRPAAEHPPRRAALLGLHRPQGRADRAQPPRGGRARGPAHGRPHHPVPPVLDQGPAADRRAARAGLPALPPAWWAARPADALRLRGTGDDRPRAVDRHARLQGGRGGRARGRGARARTSARATRSSSCTTSTRTRRSRSSSGWRPSTRRSAACATTSAGACSTR